MFPVEAVLSADGEGEGPRGRACRQCERRRLRERRYRRRRRRRVEPEDPGATHALRKFSHVQLK